MKRVRAKLTAILPLAFLAGCSDEEISKSISDGVKSALWFVAKIILISLALIMAWAAVVAAGVAVIVAGVRRKRVDAVALGAMVLGGGIVVVAWPLVFSQSGLAGKLAPGSTTSVKAGPVVGQIIAVVAAVVVAVVLVHRHRRRAAARQQVPTAPEPVAEPIAEVAAEVVSEAAPILRLRAPKATPKHGPQETPAPRPRARSRAKAGSKSR
ncbi:MAG: hypothetical protein ACRDKS_08250 [Actinomycetota bacterium]